MRENNAVEIAGEIIVAVFHRTRTDFNTQKIIQKRLQTGILEKLEELVALVGERRSFLAEKTLISPVVKKRAHADCG
jgi:hypothetical protein